MVIPALSAHLAHFLEAMYSSISAAYCGITNAYLSETTSINKKNIEKMQEKCEH